MGMREKAETTLGHLSTVKAASEGAEEAEALDSLRSELLEVSERISYLASNAMRLRNEGVPLSEISEIAAAADAIKKAHSRFEENPKATTLRRGTGWKSLKDKLDALARNGRLIQAGDWKTYFEEKYFKGLPPDQRENTLAPTPANKKAIANYRTLYKEFIQYRNQIPNNPEEFKSLRDLSEQLTDVTFQDDVPEDVRIFLNATSTGAALDLLTSEVLDWLRENHLSSNFIVRAKAI